MQAGRPSSWTGLRICTILLAGLQALIWLVFVQNAAFSTSDPAGRGLDQAFGVFATVFFGLTGAPALLLAARGRAPRLALTLALAGPALFGLGLVWFAAS